MGTEIVPKEETSGRGGARTTEASLEIEGTIDQLRLKGWSVADIVGKTTYTKELVTQKMVLLEKMDQDVGEKINVSAKKRELDLQYLQLIKELKQWAEDLSDDQIKNKLECQKLVKEIISERAKLWSINGAVSSVANIRMNNVENVILGGNLNKKQLNVIGDIIAGKIKPEELGERHDAVIECGQSEISGSEK